MFLCWNFCPYWALFLSYHNRSFAFIHVSWGITFLYLHWGNFCKKWKITKMSMFTHTQYNFVTKIVWQLKLITVSKLGIDNKEFGHHGGSCVISNFTSPISTFITFNYHCQCYLNHIWLFSTQKLKMLLIEGLIEFWPGKWNFDRHKSCSPDIKLLRYVCLYIIDLWTSFSYFHQQDVWRLLFN